MSEPKFQQGDIIRLKGDRISYSPTNYHVDEIFLGQSHGEVIYRISFKEKHTDHPKTALTDGWGFETVPKE